MTKSVALLSALCAVSASSLALGGDPTEVIAEGLVLPIGVEADPNNNIWVSEMGAPSPTDPPGTPGVGRVSMLAANLDGTYTQVPLVENIQVARRTVHAVLNELVHPIPGRQQPHADTADQDFLADGSAEQLNILTVLRYNKVLGFSAFVGNSFLQVVA